MDAETFINEILADTLEVAAADLTASSQRSRVLNKAQAAYQLIWCADEWDFRQVTGGTTTLTAGSYSAVTPDGFHTLGSDGSVWIQNTYELGKSEKKWVNKIRKQYGTATGRPSIFAVSGQDSSTKRPTLLFDVIADANYTIEIDYLKVCPTLIDDDTASGLEDFPDEHVQSVLIPATIELLASNSGDGRVIGELGPRGKAALASMKAHRNQQLPDDSRLGDLGVRRFGMH